jgi:hypothetical protein
MSKKNWKLACLWLYKSHTMTESIQQQKWLTWYKTCYLLKIDFFFFFWKTSVSQSSLAKSDDPQYFSIHPLVVLNSRWYISLTPANASRTIKTCFTTLMWTITNCNITDIFKQYYQVGDIERAYVLWRQKMLKKSNNFIIGGASKIRQKLALPAKGE